jgi:hypothetical protein
MASRTSLFVLDNFLDKSGLQAYDMSTFIRRYSHYVNEKAVAYRAMAYDFCRVKRGWVIYWTDILNSKSYVYINDCV